MKAAMTDSFQDNLNVKENKKPRRKRQDQSVFAKNLNRLLKERGLSHRVTAQMCGVSQSTLADWSAGAAPNNLHKVSDLARALGVSFSYLCLGVENDTSKDEIGIDDLYDEEPTSFQGLFKLQATKLIRKKRTNK